MNVLHMISINFIDILQKPVFERVAHEALSECVTSLHFASNAMAAKKVRSVGIVIEHLILVIL